jgi:hypothetical protein
MGLEWRGGGKKVFVIDCPITPGPILRSAKTFFCRFVFGAISKNIFVAFCAFWSFWQTRNRDSDLKALFWPSGTIFEIKKTIRRFRKFRKNFSAKFTTESRVARFSLVQHTKNIPNGHKLYQIAVYRSNGHMTYQHLPLQEPPKFTQIWIFGLKNCHLATLAESRKF